jgi:two-component system, chemotaxis family, CheB/CheR fusion protein
MSEQTPVEEPADTVEAEFPEDPSFERLLHFLRDSRSFDFTGYKRPSLMRRVRHRMREIGIDSFEDYQDVLQLEPREFTALFDTILINVTSFFRDCDAWEQLRTEIVPQVLEASGGGALRVWSAGCSAGQEAYSIAMLLQVEMGSSFRERVKIYATDVDEAALNYARQASYTERQTRGLLESYRERYFDLVNGRYIFTPDLRRSVIFGRNDLTSDAPIGRIDILLCRNTLMYLNAETQTRVVSRLGFALRQDGVLFIGKAEMLLNHASVFDPIDLKRRLFRRVRVDVAEGAGFGGGDVPEHAHSSPTAPPGCAASFSTQILLRRSLSGRWPPRHGESAGERFARSGRS